MEIGLFFAAVFAAAFVLPLVFAGRATFDGLLPGLPAALLAAVGIALAARRATLGAVLLLVLVPAAIAVGLEAVEAPRGNEGVGRELSLAVTGVAYFLGSARALGGPAGRLPSGSAQPALLLSSLLLLALGTAGASLEDAAHYEAHFGEGALEARFLGGSLALALGSVTLLTVGPALARAPRLVSRPPRQRAGRVILYVSLAIVGILLLGRLP